MNTKLRLLLTAAVVAVTGLVGGQVVVGQEKKPQFAVGEEVVIKWKERRVLGKVKEDVSQFYGRIVEFEFQGAKQVDFFLERDIEYPIAFPPARIVEPSVTKGPVKPFDPNEPFPGAPPIPKFVARKEPKISNIKLLEITKSAADKLTVFTFSMTIEPGRAPIGSMKSEHFFWVCIGDPGEIGFLRDEISDQLENHGALKAMGREKYLVHSLTIRRSQKPDEKDVWIVPVAISSEQLAGDKIEIREAKYPTSSVPLFFVVADDDNRVSDEVAYKLDATKLRTLPNRTATPANTRKAWQLGAQFATTAQALAAKNDRMPADQLHEQAVKATTRVLGFYERSGNKLTFPSLPERKADEKLDCRQASIYLETMRDNIQAAVLFCFDAQRGRPEMNYGESDRCTATFRLAMNANLLSLVSRLPDEGEPGDRLSSTLRMFLEDGRRSGLPEEFWKPLADKVERRADPQEVADALAKMLRTVSDHLEQRLK